MIKEHLKEEWRDLNVEGCGHRYKISSYGRVYDKQVERYVSQVLTGKPEYFYVNLTPTTKDGVMQKRILRRVHNLVGKVFLPNSEGYKIVDHIDNNRYNNSLDNLRWTNHKGNGRNLKNQRTIFGQILIDWCEENNVSASILISIKKDYNLHTFEEAYQMFLSEEYKVAYYQDDKYRFITREDFCKHTKLSLDYLNTVVARGVPLKQILYQGYVYPLPKDKTHKGIECENIWYPSFYYIDKRYNITEGIVSRKYNEEGLTIKQSIFEAKTYGKHLYKGKYHSLQELEKISPVSAEIISNRLFSKKWSIEKSVETPLLKSKFFMFNGERVAKKYIFEYFGINAKTANAAHCKTKYKEMSLPEFLVSKYNININNHSIEPA